MQQQNKWKKIEAIARTFVMLNSRNGDETMK